MSEIRKVGRPRKLTLEQEKNIYQQKVRDLKKVEELVVDYNVSSSTMIRIIRKFSEVKN